MNQPWHEVALFLHELASAKAWPCGKQWPTNRPMKEARKGTMKLAIGICQKSNSVGLFEGRTMWHQKVQMAPGNI